MSDKAEQQLLDVVLERKMNARTRNRALRFEDKIRIVEAMRRDLETLRALRKVRSTAA